jgi:hypothetical protein
MHPAAERFFELLGTHMPDLRVVDRMANALQREAMSGAIDRTFGTLGEGDFTVCYDYEGELGKRKKNNRQKDEKAVNKARWPAVLRDVVSEKVEFPWFVDYDESFLTDEWMHALNIEAIPDLVVPWYKHVTVKEDSEPNEDEVLLRTVTGYWTHSEANLRTIFIKRAQQECVIDDELLHWNALRVFLLLHGPDHQAFRVLKGYLEDVAQEEVDGVVKPFDPFIVGANITTTSNFRSDLLAPVRVLLIIHWLHLSYVLHDERDAFLEPLLREVFLRHLHDPYGSAKKLKDAVSLVTNALGSRGMIGIRVEYPNWQPGVHATGPAVQRRVYKDAPMLDNAAYERQAAEITEAISQMNEYFGPETAALLTRLLGSPTTSVPEIIRWHHIALYLLEIVGYGRSNTVMSFRKQLSDNIAPGYSGKPPEEPMKFVREQMRTYMNARVAKTGHTVLPTPARIFRATVRSATTKSAGVPAEEVTIELPPDLTRHLRRDGGVVKLTLNSKKAYLLIRGTEGFMKFANNGVIMTVGVRVVLGVKAARAIVVVPGDIAMVTRALFLDALTEFTKERALSISTNELAGDISDHAAIMAATGNEDLYAFMDDASRWDAHLIGPVWRKAFEDVMLELTERGGAFSTPVLGFESLSDMVKYYLAPGNAWDARLASSAKVAPADYMENPAFMDRLAELGISLSLVYPGLASGQIYTLLLNSLAHISIKESLFESEDYIKALGDMTVLMYRVLGDDTLTVCRIGYDEVTAARLARIINVVSKHYARFNQAINESKSTANRWAAEYTKLRATAGVSYATYLTPWTHEKRQLQFPVEAARNDVELVAANATRGCNIKRWMHVLLLRWLFLRRHRVPHHGDTYNIWLPFSLFVTPDGGVNARFTWPGFASGGLFNTMVVMRDPEYARWVHRFATRSSTIAIDRVAAAFRKEPKFKKGTIFVRNSITGFRNRLRASRGVPQQIKDSVPRKWWFENSVETFTTSLIATAAQLKNARLALEREESYLSQDEELSLDVRPSGFKRESLTPTIVVRDVRDVKEIPVVYRLYMESGQVGQTPVYTDDARMRVLYTLLGVRTTDEEGRKEVNKLMRMLNRDGGVINSVTPELILDLFSKVKFREEDVVKQLKLIGYSPEIIQQIISAVNDPVVYVAVVTESLLGSQSMGGQFEKFFSITGGFVGEYVTMGMYSDVLRPFLFLVGIQYVIDYFFCTGRIPLVQVSLTQAVEERLMKLILKPRI